MDPMDGDEGLESEVTPNGAVTIDEETSFITISNAPIGQTPSEVPSVLREFRQPVTVTAVEMVLISAGSVERPSSGQGNATSRETPAAKDSVEVTVKLLTRRPGEEDFTEVPTDSTEQPKVRIREDHRNSFTFSWTSWAIATTVLFDAALLDRFN